MTIAGMAFNLSFAKLGMMYDTKAERAADVKAGEAKGFVMSFSARLDLSFLIPLSKRGSTGSNTGTTVVITYFPIWELRQQTLEMNGLKHLREIMEHQAQ